MAKIIIKRSSEWNSKAREIGIYINGEKRGTIGDGEVNEYEVERGIHKVFAKIDWCGSQKIEVKVDENQTKILGLSSWSKNFTWFLILGILISCMFPLLRNEFAINLPEFLLLIPIIVLLLILYYITFGRKRYLVLEE